MTKKVALIIAGEGFQTMEYHKPKDVLQEAGVEVVTVSDMLEATSSMEEKQKVDLLLSDFHPAECDGTFFIGGSGAPEHLNNEEGYRIAKEAFASGKPYGAICISPRILAYAGVLKGKKVTGWNNDNELEDILKSAEAIHDHAPVVVDGLLVTANGPLAAKDFGKEILKLI